VRDSSIKSNYFSAHVLLLGWNNKVLYYTIQLYDLIDARYGLLVNDLFIYIASHFIYRHNVIYCILLLYQNRSLVDKCLHARCDGQTQFYIGVQYFVYVIFYTR